MSGFKKVKFGNYPEYDNFIVVFKHNKQEYELECTDMGDSFAFDLFTYVKDGKEYIWDRDNPIFSNVISKGEIK
jgi:hypothetical protein